MKVLVLTVILCLFTMFSYGGFTQGCQATLGSDNIYYVRDGMLFFGGVPQYRNDNFTNVVLFTDVACSIDLGARNTSCYIQGYSGAGDAYGTLVSYSTSPVDCPLDNYTYFLLFASTVLGFLLIRKKHSPRIYLNAVKVN